MKGRRRRGDKGNSLSMYVQREVRIQGGKEGEKDVGSCCRFRSKEAEGREA